MPQFPPINTNELRQGEEPYPFDDVRACCYFSATLNTYDCIEVTTCECVQDYNGIPKAPGSRCSRYCENSINATPSNPCPRCNTVACCGFDRTIAGGIPLNRTEDWTCEDVPAQDCFNQYNNQANPIFTQGDHTVCYDETYVGGGQNCRYHNSSYPNTNPGEVTCCNSETGECIEFDVGAGGFGFHPCFDVNLVPASLINEEYAQLQCESDPCPKRVTCCLPDGTCLWDNLDQPGVDYLATKNEYECCRAGGVPIGRGVPCGPDTCGQFEPVGCRRVLPDETPADLLSWNPDFCNNSIWRPFIRPQAWYPTPEEDPHFVPGFMEWITAVPIRTKELTNVELANNAEPCQFMIARLIMIDGFARLVYCSEFDGQKWNHFADLTRIVEDDYGVQQGEFVMAGAHRSQWTREIHYYSRDPYCKGIEN